MDAVELESTNYEPRAIYYQDSDALEYVRRDSPQIYRRVDAYLTLVLDMNDRKPVGFKLKGFRHLYERTNGSQSSEVFVEVSRLLEACLTDVAEEIFSERDARIAYEHAIGIASSDEVRIEPSEMAC